MEKTLESDINEMLKPLNGGLRIVMHGIENEICLLQESPEFSSLSEKQKSKANDIIILASDADFNPEGAACWYEEFRISLGVGYSLRPFQELINEAINKNHQASYGGRQL